MRKTFLRLLVIFILLLGVFAVIVAFQPADYRVTRTASVSASPATVFAQVNDFHNWEAWSPWAKLDPACKNSFEGAPAGKGAIFAWDGNKDVGQGRMTITDSRPAELVLLDLEFVKPFPSSCVTEFTFKPQGDQTIVTWTMTGKKNFISKAFCMFKNMDQMVGGDFEKGLAAMKTAAESAAKK